jgi:hypothetical protein
MDRSVDPLFSGRRLLLKSALVLTAIGLAVGAGVVVRRGLTADGLTKDGRSVFKAMARAVVGMRLPADPAERERILEGYLTELEQKLMNVPAAKRQQISLVAGMLANAPTRYLASRRWRSWDEATDEEVHEAMLRMREAGNMATEATFTVMRAVTSLAFFSSRQHWPLAGYPGPMPL